MNELPVGRIRFQLKQRRIEFVERVCGFGLKRSPYVGEDFFVIH